MHIFVPRESDGTESFIDEYSHIHIHIHIHTYIYIYIYKHMYDIYRIDYGIGLSRWQYLIDLYGNPSHWSNLAIEICIRESCWSSTKLYMQTPTFRQPQRFQTFPKFQNSQNSGNSNHQESPAMSQASKHQESSSMSPRKFIYVPRFGDKSWGLGESSNSNPDLVMFFRLAALCFSWPTIDVCLWNLVKVGLQSLSTNLLFEILGVLE